jgi:geranylgeranyl diphosphate synthase type I
MNGQLGKNYLENYLKSTDNLFNKYLQKKITEATNIGNITREVTQRFSNTARKGKKIRGSLVVLGYKACGGKNDKEILDMSLFIELAHTGLLVHDDIQDQAGMRRGLPSINKQFEVIGEKAKLGNRAKQYGEAMAINAGILAYFLALDKLMSGKFPTTELVEVGKLFAEYITKVAHGQSLDVSNMFVKDANEKELLNILRYKTAEYTGVLPLLAGARLAGLTDVKRIEALKKYGLSLGWAFQIQDDILGTFGNQKELGKDVGGDIREGKITLLVLHLEKNGTAEQRSQMKNILGNPKATFEDIITIQKIMRDSGSLEYVTNLGWKHVRQGMRQTSVITKDKKLKEILESLLYFMMERTL